MKQVIKGAPSEFSALQKLFALKLLNKVILLEDPEFNRYVEGSLMPRLQILAQFNSIRSFDESMSDASSIRTTSKLNSAHEMLKRGEKIFGPHEKDRDNSAKFLIILLDSIEKWSELDDT